MFSLRFSLGSSDEERGRYSAMTPLVAFGPRVCSFVYVEGIHGGLASQIGSKITLDAMIGKLSEPLPKQDPTILRDGISGALVQRAFTEGNKALHSYAQKMLSSGKLSASGIVAVFDSERISVGRTGGSEAVLFRGEESLRFFEGEGARSGLERHLGANRQILVDLASVRLQEGDRIIVTSNTVDERLLGAIQTAVREKRYGVACMLGGTSCFFEAVR